MVGSVLMRRQGWAIGRDQTGRIMRSLGLRGVKRSKRVFTTKSDPAGVKPLDLVQRRFTATDPCRLWVVDVTYVATWSGFAYVAFVTDVFSRRIVAWHAQRTKGADLVMIPLRMALWRREHDGHRVVAGKLIHHSDAGSQYTSTDLTNMLELQQISASIGSVGDAYDNALVESANGLYKTECIRTTIFHAGPYRAISDVEYATAGWVDWYNNQRLHSSLGMKSPIEFEQAHYATLNREPQPA